MSPTRNGLFVRCDGRYFFRDLALDSEIYITQEVKNSDYRARHVLRLRSIRCHDMGIFIGPCVYYAGCCRVLDVGTLTPTHTVLGVKCQV
jgi:hypothetical protein